MTGMESVERGEAVDPLLLQKARLVDSRFDERHQFVATAKVHVHMRNGVERISQLLKGAGHRPSNGGIPDCTAAKSFRGTPKLQAQGSQPGIE